MKHCLAAFLSLGLATQSMADEKTNADLAECFGKAVIASELNGMFYSPDGSIKLNTEAMYEIPDLHTLTLWHGSENKSSTAFLSFVFDEAMNAIYINGMNLTLRSNYTVRLSDGGEAVHNISARARSLEESIVTPRTDITNAFEDIRIETTLEFDTEQARIWMAEVAEISAGCMLSYPSVEHR